MQSLGAQQVFRFQRLARGAPGDRLARKEKSLWKRLSHKFQAMQHRHHGAPFVMPAENETDQVFDGGQLIAADAPLDRIPLFLRGGAKLPIRAVS